jgi:RNA ligase (TIGR02306 family)
MNEVKRKLASIREIAEIKPIEDADDIELAIVDGWQCVVKKDEFKKGDLCIYFEIDSFLPIRQEFEFLRKSSYRKIGDKEGFRVKTIRLRGQISQGLAISSKSLDVLPRFPFSSFIIGDDLTERLKVLKYEPPIPACLSGIMKGNFPSFIPKTDQERVQNIWSKIKDCDESFEVTVKLDGTSCTYYLKDGVFGVCSRNLELVEDDNNTLWKLAKLYKMEDILKEYGKNLALQGEVIGERIQCNHEGFKGQHFYLFDIWDIDNQKYFTPLEKQKFSDDLICRLNIIFHVPGLGTLTLDKFKSIEDILVFANGESLNAPTREGVVFKSMTSGLSFKVISNNYLLKQK